MSDIIDVQQMLVSIIAQAVYPTGTSNPSAVSGVPCIIYAGWPNSDLLDPDLRAGKVHVTVFPKAEERNVTRYSTAQQTITQITPTITTAISGQTVTLGGTVSTGQNIALLVNGQSYVYAVQGTDTLTSIATSLATLLTSIAGTSSTGPVLTVGSNGRIQAARVGSTGTVAAEYKRQERVISITIWSNSPANRDAFAALIDAALCQYEFLTMTDGYGARLIYKSSMVIDNQEKDNLYRRDLNYSAEYATTVTQTATAIVTEQINIAVTNLTPSTIATTNL
jgi:hypothetical protein